MKRHFAFPEYSYRLGIHLEANDDKKHPDWKAPFPVDEGYLVIPTHEDTVPFELDLFLNEPMTITVAKLEKRYEGVLACPGGSLHLFTSMPGTICTLIFEQAGDKRVEVWTNAQTEPTAVAIVLADDSKQIEIDTTPIV